MFRFLTRWLFRAIVLLIVLLVAGVLLVDTASKAMMESRLRSATGMDVRIGKVEIGIASPTFRMEGFRLYNTAEFGGAPLIEIPELFVEYDRDAASRQVLRLKLLRINISEINIVKDVSGNTNLDKLKAQNGQGNSPSSIQFQGIDLLNLSLGKMRMIDMKQPNQAQEFDFQLKNEVLQNVKGLNDFAGLIVKIAVRRGPALLRGGWLNSFLPGLGTTNGGGSRP